MINHWLVLGRFDEVLYKRRALLSGGSFHGDPVMGILSWGSGELIHILQARCSRQKMTRDLLPLVILA